MSTESAPSTKSTDQQQFDNEMRGVMWKNDKGGNPRRPDYRGKLTINGIEYTQAGWIRNDKEGNPYMSIQYQVAQSIDPTPQATDEIPF